MTTYNLNALPLKLFSMRIPLLQFGVSAGFSAPDEDMWRIKNFRQIRPVKNSQAKIVCAIVSGNCLKSSGIFDGDIVVFEVTQNARYGQLVIANTPCGQTLKYYFPQDDGFIKLSSERDNLIDAQTWLEDDVHIQGVVVRIERDL